MTPDEFKIWRLAKGLSHQDAADLLGASSRFVVMRWEKGSEMPSTLAARITEAESVLASTPPGQKPIGRIPTAKIDWSRHKCWTLAGQPTDMARVLEQPKGYQFYRLDDSRDVDPRTGHLKATLHETTFKWPNGEPTFLYLDLEAWDVRCIAWESDPRHVAALPKYNAQLKPQAQPAPAQSMWATNA